MLFQPLRFRLQDMHQRIHVIRLGKLSVSLDRCVVDRQGQLWYTIMHFFERSVDPWVIDIANPIEVKKQSTKVAKLVRVSIIVLFELQPYFWRYRGRELRGYFCKIRKLKSAK